MRIILDNLIFFFSPLEQFEINSFNTNLNYTITAAINFWESNYFVAKSLYSIFDIIFILSILFIFQTMFKQKSLIYLFIFINIFLVGFNWIAFTDYIYKTTEYSLEEFSDINISIMELCLDVYCDWLDYLFGPEVLFFLNIEDLVEFFLPLTEALDFDEPVLNFDNITYNYITIISQFTNIYTVSFCFIFTYFVIYLIYNKMISNNMNTIIPTLYQILAENLYKLSLNLFYSILGKHVTIPEFFIKINTIFIFLVISNIQGMIPYMSTLTSALTNTFFIALALFLSILTTLFDKKGVNYFLNLFMPSGCPILLSLLIIPIELISYSFRLVSLSVRLFANMMAGHTLLKVIVGFSWIIIFLGNTWLINLFPILILFILTLLEFGVAIIQAYIFTVLSCIYLRDIFEGH